MSSPKGGAFRAEDQQVQRPWGWGCACWIWGTTRSPVWWDGGKQSRWLQEIIEFWTKEWWIVASLWLSPATAHIETSSPWEESRGWQGTSWVTHKVDNDPAPPNLDSSCLGTEYKCPSGQVHPWLARASAAITAKTRLEIHPSCSLKYLASLSWNLSQGKKSMIYPCKSEICTWVSGCLGFLKKE